MEAKTPTLRSAALAAAVLASPLAAASACASTAAPGPLATISSYESPAEGFNTKSFFFDTGREVVVIDAQFTAGFAEASIAAIGERTKSPITHVVLTHPNPDKFGGLAAYKKRGVTIVASAATAAAMPGVHAYKKNFFVNVARMFTDETFPALVEPDVTFRDGLTLELAGGARLELREMNRPGVSSSQTIIHAPREKVLFVGDLVHANAHAWLEGGIVGGAPVPNIDGWKSALGEIAQTYPADTRVYGGRGDAVEASVGIPAQVDYLTRAESIVASFVGRLPNAMTELSGADADARYVALAKEFEAAFPGRSLSYMVRYGAYGLALQKAATK